MFFLSSHVAVSFHSFYGICASIWINTFLLSVTTWFDWDEKKKRTFVKKSQPFFFFLSFSFSLLQWNVFFCTTCSRRTTRRLEILESEILLNISCYKWWHHSYVNSMISSEANLTISMNFNALMELRDKLLTIYISLKVLK